MLKSFNNSNFIIVSRFMLRASYFLFSIAFLFYILLPNPDLPNPPSDALQSDEPADTETPLRRSYFTNLNREEILVHYQEQLKKSSFLGVPLPVYRLNYPPEEAQVLIRDQTRSTFLEEIVHPLRESLFVNGFEPKDPKDAILIQNKNWRQKITVKLIPSSIIARLIVSLSLLVMMMPIYKEYAISLRKRVKHAKKS